LDRQSSVGWCTCIAPGKRLQNDLAESFKSRLRDKCLADMLFTSLAHAGSCSLHGGAVAIP